MSQPKEGINPKLVERVRSTMQSRSSEDIDDQVPRQRFKRLGRVARVAAEEVEQEYIRSLFRGSEIPELPETPQE